MASDKMVKAGLLDSARIGGVSEFAELLFVRMILCACPLGRLRADPAAVKRDALPNRSRKRTTDVASAIEDLVRAGLIARYNAPSGEALLVIPRFGQRYKFKVRSPFPAPPGGPPDAEGQEVMPWAGELAGPVAEAELAPPPEKRSKVEVCSARARRTPPAATHSHESDSVWLSRLTAAYPTVNIEAELKLAARYVKQKRGDSAQLTRKFFEGWLTRCADAVDVQAATGKALSFKPAAEPAPDGWRDVIKESNYAPGGISEVKTWSELPKDVQLHVRRELQKLCAA